MSLDGNPSSLSDVADTSGERFHWTAHPEFHNGSDVCSIGGSGFSGPHGTVRADDYLIRIFDLSVALVILIAVAPFLLLLVVLLKLGSPGPVFFAQKRVGKNGALFSCLKFRTMVVDAQARLDHLLKTCPQSRAEWERDHKLRNDVRITPLGQFMRKFSLDELPQLINIVRGQMSIVGPRPIVEAEIWRYGPYFADYCSVRPGLTGLWQVSGRNDVSYDERVQLDRYYSRNKSLGLDLAIVARTVPVVLGARGAY